MSFEAAAAHVSIFPKFASGFGSSLSGQMRGFGDAAGREGGKSAGTGFLSVMKGVLGAQAIMGALSGVKNAITGAIGGGFDRLMNIEQAQIKLRTLGLDVEASMASVSSAVDGTKFAISDAADMAAVLGAAGVNAGEEMTRWLSLTADSAQFLNRPFADVQRNIQKIVAEGRVTGETFQELPIAAAALADHLGISQEEVRKLASQGEISAEQFAAAMESKIGGAAKNAGDSFLSLRDNIKTAMNASAAALLEPITKAMMPLMAVGLTMLKQFRDGVAKPLGESLTEFLVPRAEALAATLSQIDLAGMFQRVGTVLGPVLQLIGQYMSSQAALFSGLATALMPVFAQLGPLLQQIAPVLSQIVGTTSSIVAGLLPIITSLIAQILPPIMQLVTTVLPPLLGLVDQLLAAIAPLVLQLASELAPIIVELVNAIVPPLIAIFEAVIPVVGDLIAAIAPLIAQIAAELIPIIEALLPVVTTIFNGAAKIVQVAMGVIQGVIKTVTAIISGDWKGAWEGIKQTLSAAWDTIKAIVQVALNIVSSIISNIMPIIQAGWRNAWDTIQSALSAAWEGIKSTVSAGIDAAVGFIGELPGRALGALGNLGSYLYNSGAALVQGFKNGILGAFESVRSAVSNGLSSIRNLFPFSPAKEGPFSGRGWVYYSGLSIGEATADGIEASMRTAKAAASRFASQTSAALGLTAPDVDGTSGGFGAAGAVSGGDQFIFHPGAITIPLDDLAQLKTLDDFARMLRVKARMQGVPA